MSERREQGKEKRKIHRKERKIYVQGRKGGSKEGRQERRYEEMSGKKIKYEERKEKRERRE